MSGIGEKLGVENVVVLYGVLETDTEYGIETVLWEMTLTVGVDESLSECLVKSST